MSNISRIAMLVAASALFAVLSSTAGAVTWTNSGGTVFQASGGPTTLSIGANNLACSGSAETGTAPMSSTTSTIMTGTVVFSPCSLVGQNTFVHCTFTRYAISYSAGVTTGATALTCDARLTASPANSLCHISGTVPGTYTNPSGATPGRFTLNATTSMVVSNGNVACPLGTGNGTLEGQTWNVTSVAQSPILARDA